MKFFLKKDDIDNSFNIVSIIWGSKSIECRKLITLRVKLVELREGRPLTAVGGPTRWSRDRGCTQIHDHANQNPFLFLSKINN